MLDDLWNAIRGRSAPPPLPGHLEVRLDDEDEPDTLADLDEIPAYQGQPISGFSCILVYRDTRGRESERRVTCQRLDLAGDHLYIVAWCHERAARRQFRVDRIVSLVDLHSGELVGDPSGFFADFRVDRQQTTQPGWGLSVRKRADLVAGLNVLVFVGRCDKEWHPLERCAVEDFLGAYWIRAELPGEPPVADIIAHADRLAPDAETFYVSLSRCHGNPVLAGIIRRHVQRVIDADEVVRDEEFYWGRAIDDHFARLANEAHPAHQV